MYNVREAMEKRGFKSVAETKKAKSSAIKNKKEKKHNAAREAGQSGNWGKFFEDLTK